MLLIQSVTCRRLVQVAMSSSPIDIQISKGIKQQLGALATYLAKFDSQKVSELSQRFSQPDRDAESSRRNHRSKKPSAHHRVASKGSLTDHSSVMTRQMSGLPTSRLSKDLGAASLIRSSAGHGSEARALTASSEADEDDKVTAAYGIAIMRYTGIS